MPTGREEDRQLDVPPTLRAAVPARYGVEIIKSDPDPRVIISDQLRNRHVDATYCEDYGWMPIEMLKQRLVMPLLDALKNAPTYRVR